MEISVMLTFHWVTSDKAMEWKTAKIAIEIGNRGRRRTRLWKSRCIAYDSLGDFRKAIV